MLILRNKWRRHAAIYRVRSRNINMHRVWFWVLLNETAHIGTVASVVGMLMFPYQLFLPLLLFVTLGILSIYTSEKRLDLLREMIDNMRHTKDEKFILRTLSSL